MQSSGERTCRGQSLTSILSLLSLIHTLAVLCFVFFRLSFFTHSLDDTHMSLALVATSLDVLPFVFDFFAITVTALDADNSREKRNLRMILLQSADNFRALFVTASRLLEGFTDQTPTISWREDQ